MIANKYTALPVVGHHKVRLKIVLRHANLIEEILTKLLAAARAAAEVPRLVLAIAQPTPLKVAMPAGDVIAPAILLDMGLAVGARLRVLLHPLGRLHLLEDALTIFCPQCRAAGLIGVAPARREICAR